MTPPFDTDKLDALMDAANVDVVVATSRHNVRYLAGAYSTFFERFDAIGIDRYVPAFGYTKGDPGRSFRVGSELDQGQEELEPTWASTVVNRSQTATESADEVGSLLSSLGLARGTIALEHSFAPASFVTALANALPSATLVEAHPLLEELRAVKTLDELALLRAAAEEIVGSIVAAVGSGAPGITTRELANRVREEESSRGLEFEYCLIATGASFNRIPSGSRWEEGAVASLDSGGHKRGYIGDLCRMAVFGEPTGLMRELLAEVDAIQRAARGPVRPGAIGAEIYEAALAEKQRCAHGDLAVFVAHGMGLVSHEAPRLTDSGPIRYPASHRNRPLEAGMVLSIETDLKAPGVGFIKLEDTVVVTPAGHEAYGDEARDWIVVPG
jgi:Xaa-Pro aminopeptidase